MSNSCHYYAVTTQPDVDGIPWRVCGWSRQETKAAAARHAAIVSVEHIHIDAATGAETITIEMENANA